MKKTLLFALLILTVAGVWGYFKYSDIYAPVVKKKGFIHIYPHYTIDQLAEVLLDSGYISDKAAFLFTSDLKKFKTPKAGRYKISVGNSNNSLVNRFRSGNQTAVKFTFNNIRSLDEFAARAAEVFIFSEEELNTYLNAQSTYLDKQLPKEQFISIFIPNTYEIYWNITPQGLVDRMYKESNLFWKQKNRMQKANALDLKPYEVVTLASIVEEETVKNDEKPKVAGLYLNRLKRGMRLESDPTVKFAMGDFTIKRILTKDLQIKSPYNTYKVKGLPPGPIRIASIQGIDAVLNYKKHDYLFMCAKEDFSGYHNFAKTLSQHNQNAEKYRRALNKNRIYR